MVLAFLRYILLDIDTLFQYPWNRMGRIRWRDVWTPRKILPIRKLTWSIQGPESRMPVLSQIYRAFHPHPATTRGLPDPPWTIFSVRALPEYATWLRPLGSVQMHQVPTPLLSSTLSGLSYHRPRRGFEAVRSPLLCRGTLCGKGEVSKEARRISGTCLIEFLLCIYQITLLVFYTSQAVVCGSSDWMNGSTGKANIEAGLVGALRCCPFLLVKMNVAVSIMNTVGLLG